MKMKEFSIYVKDMLQKTFNDDVTVEIQTIKKSNGVSLNGLVIRNSNSNIAPTIYLERFYERYTDGEDIENIIDTIRTIYENNKKNNIEIDNIMNYESIKDKIYPRLIGKMEWNNDEDGIVYSQYLDLKMIYCIDVDEIDHGTIRVTEKLMETWNKKRAEIHINAMENLYHKKDATFNPMIDILKDMMPCASDQLDEIQFEESPLYVISNKDKIFGATSIFNKSFMREMLDKVGDDLVLLPSSVHEWIAMKYSDMPNIDELEDMVVNVNMTQVERQDWLSDHVYLYTRDDGLLEIQ